MYNSIQTFLKSGKIVQAPPYVLYTGTRHARHCKATRLQSKEMQDKRKPRQQARSRRAASGMDTAACTKYYVYATLLTTGQIPAVMDTIG